MEKNRLALLAASLALGLAFLACRAPGLGGGTPTFIVSEAGEAGEPGAPISTPAPGVPTNTDGAETIVIPGGTFWMGSEATDTVADEDEKPRHQVTLGTFPIYTHEVTNEMYARCVEAGACTPIQVLEGGPTSHYDDPAFAEHPVVGVDWNMADDYCTWAGARLPTEAEWEYAARGADSLVYPWGSEDPACDRVNMGGCFTPADTAEVGSYLLGNSPFEVWDLSGNVWEWTHDWYDPDYYARSPSSAPLGPNLSDDPANPQKVVRGGGMNSDAIALRGAARIGARPLRPYDDVGFRCVAQPPLDLPAGYAEVPEGHEWVPPDSLDGGGETVEDPDDGIDRYSMGHSFATCPDAEGRMQVTVEAETTVPGDYSVTVEGLPYDCTYDDVAHLLTCEGPVPGSTEYPDVYHVMVYFPGGGIIGHAYPDIATDCPVDWLPPLEFTATADCPAEGWVNVYFHYEPGLTVDTLQLDGSEVALHWPIGDNQTNAIVPARAPGDAYFFYLHGTDAEGREYSARPTVVIPADCEPEQKAVEVAPVCYLDRPSIAISTLPDTMVMDSVSVGGAPLPCITIALGHYVCGDLVDPPGSEVTVNLCFDGDPCFDHTVTVPSCPGDSEIAYSMIPGCYATLGAVVTINYSPADQPLVAANANGADLTCVDSDVPGLYMCYTLPGAPGSEMTITFCLADGSCYSEAVVVRDCTVPAEPTGGAFRFAGAGCHDETHIHFIIDTGLGWLVPGAAYTYSATDEGNSYSCSVHPTIPGRLYCSGDRPESPGTMQICIDRDGPDPLICEYFDDWPAQVAIIPDCAPPPPEFSCSSITSPSACDLDPLCHWEKGPVPPQGCYPP